MKVFGTKIRNQDLVFMCSPIVIFILGPGEMIIETATGFLLRPIRRSSREFGGMASGRDQAAICFMSKKRYSLVSGAMIPSNQVYTAR